MPKTPFTERILAPFQKPLRILGAVTQAADRLISTDQSRWVRNSNRDTVIVFVHGFLSQGEKAWSTKSSDWFDIIQADKSFDQCDLYQAEWYTTAFSASYDLEDAAKILASDLATPTQKLKPVWDYPNIVFVGHSMGGILFRKVLIDHADHLEEAQITCLTLSTPALGVLATDPLLKFKWLPRNALLNELQPTNSQLNQIHQHFLELCKSRPETLTGLELHESHLVAPRISQLADAYSYFGHPAGLVSAESQGHYFGPPVEVPNSDHRSISRPTSPDSPVHQYLTKLVHSWTKPHPAP